jgi:2-iminobutanoate/2-iminopropanoate deaminase
MIKTEVRAKNAPNVVGPYSQAVDVGDFIFCSGQIGINPDTNEMVKGGIKEQTLQVFENLGHVLKAGGANFNDLVKTTVYMIDLEEFAEMNRIYEKYFKKPYPARATVQVAKLPKNAKIEIEAIAYIK